MSRISRTTGRLLSVSAEPAGGPGRAVACDRSRRRAAAASCAAARAGLEQQVRAFHDDALHLDPPGQQRERADLDLDPRDARQLGPRGPGRIGHPDIVDPYRRVERPEDADVARDGDLAVERVSDLGLDKGLVGIEIDEGEKPDDPHRNDEGKKDEDDDHVARPHGSGPQVTSSTALQRLRRRGAAR